MSKLLLATTIPSYDWETPDYIFDALDKIHHFDLDVCATAENTKCERYFNIEQNALDQSWAGYTCWMNPPHGKDGPSQWLYEAYCKSEAPGGAKKVVCLVKAATDTQWWHRYAMKAEQILFIEGRINFIPPPGWEEVNGPATSNNHGSALLIYTRHMNGAPFMGSWSPKHPNKRK